MKGWVLVLVLGAVLGVLFACVLTSGYEGRQSQLNQAIADRESAQAQAEVDQSSIDSMGQELARKDEQIQSANTERDQANSDGVDDSAQISLLNTQVSDLSSHVSSLMLQLNAANQSFDEKSAEAAQLLEQNHSLQAQLDQSRQENTAATARIQSLDVENQRLRDEVQAQSQKITALEATITQALIPVTGGAVEVFPGIGRFLDAEQVYAILIIYVCIWIVLGIGCGIYLVFIRNRVRSK